MPYSTAAMRRLALVMAAAGPLALGACGGAGSTASKPPVRLTVDAPADGAVVRQGSVEVSGRVSPAGAAVTVRGQSAAVARRAISAIFGAPSRRTTPNTIVPLSDGRPRRVTS